MSEILSPLPISQRPYLRGGKVEEAMLFEQKYVKLTLFLCCTLKNGVFFKPILQSSLLFRVLKEASTTKIA